MSRSWITSAAVLVAVGASSAYAQPAPARALTGSVVDATTGLPVVGALVATGVLEVTTDERGEFVLADAGTGWLDVVVVADGYDPLVQRARAGARITLKLSANSLLGGAELITIEETREVDGRPPTYDVTADVVRTLPGSGNDALKSLQSLPGTARVPFGLGGLVVRGAAPRDTNIFLDGIEVPILYHFGGLASFLPSTMIDSMELVSSGYGVRYGRGQGGLVDIRSRGGRADRWTVGSELSLLDASARAEGPALGGTASVGLRRSFVDAVLAAVPTSDLTLLPRYLDSQVRWQSRSGKLTALLFGADDGIAFSTGDSVLDARQSFVRAGVRYADKRGATGFTVVPWIGFDRTAVVVQESSVIRSNATAALRATVQHTLDTGFVAGGLDLQANRYAYQLATEPPPLPPGAMPAPTQRDGTRWAADLGVWGEYSYRFAGDRFAIQPGLRGDRLGLTNEWVLDPRLSFRQLLTPAVTLSQSIGRYHQPPLATAIDYQLPGSPLRASYAWQATAGVSVVSERLGGDINVTAFGAALRDLPVDAVTGATPTAAPGSAASGGASAAIRDLTEEQLGRYAYQTSAGRGRTYGIETQVRRRVGPVQGWIAYTYSRSFRQGDPWSMESYAPYILDQPHVLTALATMPLGSRWRVGARVRLASGNPITPTTGRYFDTSQQEFVPLSGAALSARLPLFAQLDVRVDREWRRSWGTLKLFLDVQNVSNRVNAEGVSYNFDYTSQQYTRGLPVFPSLGLELAL